MALNQYVSDMKTFRRSLISLRKKNREQNKRLHKFSYEHYHSKGLTSNRDFFKFDKTDRDRVIFRAASEKRRKKPIILSASPNHSIPSQSFPLSMPTSPKIASFSKIRRNKIIGFWD